MRLEDFDDFDWEPEQRFPVKKIILIAVVVCVIGVLAAVLILGVVRRNTGNEPEDSSIAEITDTVPITTESQTSDYEEADNEAVSIELNLSDTDTSEEAQVQVIMQEAGSEVDQASLSRAVAENEISGTSIGIDVAKYQGTIDFQKVAEAGVEFAIVRIGYRTAKTGVIMEDVNAAYNLQQASANGILLGAYFFSTAITEEEAREEADFVADFIASYPITYPVAYNCEGFLDSENRNYGLTVEERTKIAIAFLDEIQERGYTPMFYSSRNEMENNLYWDMTQLENSYRVWVSQYPALPYPDTPASSYSGIYDMWQYTNQGTIPGIEKNVDVNVAYFRYASPSAAMNDEKPEEAKPDVEALMNFVDVSETVTAKSSTNLRSEPSTTGDTVVTVLSNGQTATRTGIDEAAGWSRVEYNGQILYAVSSYLTTDLSVKPVEQSQPQEEAPSGTVVDGVEIQTQFTPVNEQVSAKEIVNLRSLPSVTNEAVRIVGTLSYGEVVTRTGINTDYGWSRLEYNGETVYAISSYLWVVESSE